MKSTLRKNRLADLHHALLRYIERNEVPGVVSMVSVGNELQVETLGRRALDRDGLMERDTLFRIASITKPIAAAATMMLIEQGAFNLDQSIEAWLPELANRRVLTSIAASLDDTVPAKRPIAIRDLLNFTFGFGSVMAAPGTYPIQNAVSELKLGGDGPPHPDQTPPSDEWLRRLASLPLMYQPGERWAYHNAADVLGILIARVARQSFGEFLQERIFAPLGMQDTAFYVPKEKLRRLTACYVYDASGHPSLFDGIEGSEYDHPPKMESAGGGLVSTADDLLCFFKMLLNRGMHDNRRILTAQSVELMTRDQLTPTQRVGSDIFFGDYRSWGFGGAVNFARDPFGGAPGRYGWDGGKGTSAYIDPEHDFVGILLTQRMLASPEPPPIFRDFWTLAYRAMN